MANAVRIRTASGWQDIALSGPVGPQGAPGTPGAPGPQGTMAVYQQPNAPASPAIGTIWIDTDEVPVVATAIRTMRTGQSFIIGGSLVPGMIIPPFFVPIMGVGQTTNIIGVRSKILATATSSIVIQLTQNGTSIGTAVTVSTTKATTAFGIPVAIADGDEIGLVLSTPTNTPAHLSLTVIFEHTV